MIYPEKLKKGDMIEIISPSNGVKPKKISKLENGIKRLEDYGFEICEDKYVRNSINGASSSPKKRSAELKNAITNKKVKALIACSGGDFIVQILSSTKYKNIKDNIKWIQGQSDITGLLYYITTKYDIATIYSFNAKTYGDYNIPKNMIDNSIEFLKGNTPIQTEYGYKIEEENIKINWECINNFKNFEGRIIGGCLDSLKDIIGTKFDNTKQFIKKYKNDGIVWYFDVAEMTNEDILRTMWQLKEAGWFKYCSGIIFGRLAEEITYTDTSLKNSILYCLSNLKIPIIINADIGHTDPVFTIINGSCVKISYDEKYRMETVFK